MLRLRDFGLQIGHVGPDILVDHHLERVQFFPEFSDPLGVSGQSLLAVLDFCVGFLQYEVVLGDFFLQLHDPHFLFLFALDPPRLLFEQLL